MGCGTSLNQVHEVNNPIPAYQISNDKISKRQQNGSLSLGKCFLFGQSLGERKVVHFNASKHQFTTLSSRIRIPIPKLKLEPIEILYEESQEIILPELMKKGPNPPFNFMFGTFCRKEVIFLCGGINYEGDQVVSQSFFYNLNPEYISKSKNSIAKTYIKFQTITPMNVKRYSHMGIYYYEGQNKNQYIYIFGGKGIHHQSLQTCQKFDLATRTWKNIAPMLTPRSQGYAMLFMGSIYVFGGISTHRQFPQNIQVYDPQSDIWKMMNIRLHRGIRACLVIAAKPNEIIIFGGNAGQQDLRAVIKVNLIQQTYIWQTNLPEEISNIKSAYDNEKLFILSNQSNAIHSYDFNTKIWKNLGFGYKSYLPINDIRRFTCVGQPLHLKFDANLAKELEQQQYNIAKQINSKRNNKEFKSLFVLGNQNYPCILKITQCLTNKSEYSIEINRVSMNLRLKSKMSIIQTERGYFICGGTDYKQKHPSNQTFFYDPYALVYKSVEELASMSQPKFSPAIYYMNSQQRQQENIYIMGGAKNYGTYLKTVQKYNFKEKRWVNSGELSRPRHSMKTHRINSRQDKVLVIGGYEQAGIYSSLIQVYDGQKEQVVASNQYAALTKNGRIMQIFMRELPSEQLKLIDVKSQILPSSSEKQIQSPPLLQVMKQKVPKSPKKINSFTKLAAEHIPSNVIQLTNIQTIHIKPTKKQTSAPIQPIQNSQDISNLAQYQSSPQNRGFNIKRHSQQDENIQFMAVSNPKNDSLERQYQAVKPSQVSQYNELMQQKSQCLPEKKVKQQQGLQQIIISQSSQNQILKINKTNSNKNITVNPFQIKPENTRKQLSTQLRIQQYYGIRIYIYLYSVQIQPQSEQILDEESEKQMEEKSLYEKQMESIIKGSDSNSKIQKQQSKVINSNKNVNKLQVYDVLVNKNDSRIRLYHKNNSKNVNRKQGVFLEESILYNFAYEIKSNNANSSKHYFLNLINNSNKELDMKIYSILPQKAGDKLSIQQIPATINNLHENNVSSNNSSKIIQNIVQYADLQTFSMAKFYSC